MDVGAWDGSRSPSWSQTGAEHVAELLAAQHLEPREREVGERVMVCYRSGTTFPGTVAIARDDEGSTVVVDDLYGGTVGLVGLFPPTILRTIVLEQCVPLDVIERVYVAEREREQLAEPAPGADVQHWRCGMPHDRAQPCPPEPYALPAQPELEPTPGLYLTMKGTV